MSCAHLKNNRWFLCTCDLFSYWQLWALLHICKLSPPWFTEIQSLTLSLLLCSECWAREPYSLISEWSATPCGCNSHEWSEFKCPFIAYWITCHELDCMSSTSFTPFLICITVMSYSFSSLTAIKPTNLAFVQDRIWDVKNHLWTREFCCYTHWRAWCHCSRSTSSVWVRPHREYIVQFWDLQ